MTREPAARTDGITADAGPPGGGRDATEHAFDQGYWDQVWAGDRAAAMGETRPSPHLVREVGDLPPRSALDAGCGSGAEAIWLAERGWTVTGADIAAAALDRAAERAAAAGVTERTRWLQVDLSTWEPDEPYDLVTTHYAHPAMPQLDFYDRIAGWVRPSGTLLIVGHLRHDGAEGHEHDHGHDRSGSDGGGHDAGSSPASASATAAEIAARLEPAQWRILTSEESRRTVSDHDGHGTILQDVVVRATRLA